MGEREKGIEKLLEDLENKNPVLKMFGILGRVIRKLEKRIEYLEQANETRFSDLADDKD